MRTIKNKVPATGFAVKTGRNKMLSEKQMDELKKNYERKIRTPKTFNGWYILRVYTIIEEDARVQEIDTYTSWNLDTIIRAANTHYIRTTNKGAIQYVIYKKQEEGGQELITYSKWMLKK